VLSGTGYNPGKSSRIAASRLTGQKGIDYSLALHLRRFQPDVPRHPYWRFFADMFTERNPHGDLQSVIHQFEAAWQRDPDDHQAKVVCPTIILSGSEDGTHQSAFALKAHSGM
jgi:pimeloyl-ACP methyl ester carboxylesterase